MSFCACFSAADTSASPLACAAILASLPDAFPTSLSRCALASSTSLSPLAFASARISSADLPSDDPTDRPSYSPIALLTASVTAFFTSSVIFGDEKLPPMPTSTAVRIPPADPSGSITRAV